MLKIINTIMLTLIAASQIVIAFPTLASLVGLLYAYLEMTGQ